MCDGYRFIVWAFVALSFLALPAMAQYKVQVNPVGGIVSTYNPIDLESVDTTASMPISEWAAWVNQNNEESSAYITVESLGEISVTAARLRDRGASPKEFFEEARKAAAALGGNKLHVEETVTEGNTGRLVSVTYQAYRVSYRDFVISPAFLAALPYNPLPDNYVEAQLSLWDSRHGGKLVPADRKTLIATIKRLKAGASVRMALRDGSSVRGRFDGLENDHIWIQPNGVRGLFLDRAVNSADVQAISLLN